MVADKGTVIKPQHIMALATVGIQKVNVLCKQKVAIITTGNELFNVKSGKLYSGAIFNSNKPFLRAYLNELNCEPVFIGSCKDDEKALNDLIDYSLLKEVKMIFSTGALNLNTTPKSIARRVKYSVIWYIPCCGK